jgi:hypothetical protein
MQDTVNAVVNNLADRTGDAVSALAPAIDKVGEISQTVIQETTNYGFYGVMMGLVIIGIASLSCLFLALEIRFLRKTDGDREFPTILLTFVTALLGVIGFIVVGENFQPWIAPTKQVIYEVIEKCTSY